MFDLDFGTIRWEKLGTVRLQTLADARLQQHWALQIVAAVGATYVAPRIDFSHTSLTWYRDARALVAQNPCDASPFQAGLRLHDLTLLLLDSEKRQIDGVALAGQTLDQAQRWVENALAKYAGLESPLTRPLHDIPAHPIGDGVPFSVNEPQALEELSRWFDNADSLFSEVQTRVSAASPVRCWPHHFDIATLITLKPHAELEKAVTIGVGMTPGDAQTTEPYFYVTPWPYPPTEALPTLDGGGRWHTDGWVGALLRGQDLTATSNPKAQAKTAMRYVRSSLEASRHALGM